jgi:hypothetical protein
LVKISKIDWDIINARVHSIKKGYGLSTLSEGLLSIVLEQLFPNIQDQLQEAITDGTEDQGVDAIHILESENSAEVFIFQSKYRESYSSAAKTINETEVIKVSHFLSELFAKSPKLADHNNLRLKEAVKRIWALHEAGKICRYQVIFCSNGGGLSEPAKKICEALTSTNSQISYEYYGGTQIINGMSSEGRAPENGSLQVVGREILERSDGDVRGLIASVDASSFIKLISADNGTGIKRHLFDDNLRVFLGAKGGYNPSIIRTATSSDSYLFWYLNNGVTITCKNFAYNKAHTNPTIRFEDFQIVNGAQTSHSLIEAERAGSEELNNVVLMVRIYATDREDIAERVAVATNSQARIQGRDLRSNSQIMKKLELGLSERGYFFERKRNMHADKEAANRVDALKLGQILLSFDLREPDKAKSESDSIFDSRFDLIFNDKLEIDHVVRLIELYRIIEDLRDIYISENRGALESGQSNQYLIYGHWFILFACKLLMVKEHTSVVPSGQSAQDLVHKAIQLVADTSRQHKAVAHYQMFRSPRTKDKLIAELGAKQLDFFNSWASDS